MTAEEKKEALLRWNEHCQRLLRLTSKRKPETEAERKKNIARALKDYDYFCRRYLSHYCQCPNARFHNEAARYIEKHREMRAVFKWPRGHAKSVHLDVGIPLWLKFKGELHVMVLVGKSEDNADALLSDLQAELQFNQYIVEDFGEQYNSGCWQEGEFVTKDQCAFFSRGRGQSPRGLRFRDKRPDYIVVDDLDDVGVFFSIGIGNFAGVVLGAVIHKDDLGVLPRGEEGLDAMVHICGRVVARHGKGDKFHRSLLLKGIIYLV